MATKFPYADHLTTEEINYELKLRNYSEEIEKDVQTKLRLLRRLFQTDQKEGREYRPPVKFEQEYDIITSRVQQIQMELEKGDDPKLVSQLRHYFLRVKRGETSSEDMEEKRKELRRAIKELLQSLDDIPIEDNAGSAHDGNASQQDDGIKKLGTILKNPPSQKEQQNGSDLEIRKLPYNVLVRKLEAALQQLRTQDSQGNQEERKKKGKVADVKETRKAKSSRTEANLSENLEPIMIDRNTQDDRRRQIGERQILTDDSHSDSGEDERNRRRGRHNRHDRQRGRRSYDRSDSEDSGEDKRNRDRGGHNRHDRQGGRRSYDQSDSGDSREGERNRDRPRNNRDDRPGRRSYGRSDSRDSVSTDRRGEQRNRGIRHYRRIEHWRLSFSGDSKSISVENFLYKLKKIAEREGVSERNLLRDIHLILEGQASDWFFTYVDEFEDWDDFEDRIRYRFGNPNQDQGIRLKIQERKQQRGETFSAFVSEIERLNKMLSKPLSNRRKFEVVWDNMRHHYRSRIATIKVRNLDHLTRLNHSIDAVDPNLQFSSEMRSHRNVHHIDCELSDDGSDEHEEVDAIETRTDKRNPRPSHRSATVNDSQTPVQAQQNVCWNCRKQGHNWRDCKETKAIFCYGCGNLGRTIRSCPKCAGSRQQRGDGNQGNQ